MSEPALPVRPEILASKLEKIENFEQPRLFEEFVANPRLIRALWFLQWVSQPSNYPGGLTKFAVDFIDASCDRIGTAAMLSAQAARNDRYSIEDAISIFGSLPDATQREVIENSDDVWLVQILLLGYQEDDYWSDEPRPQRIAQGRLKEARSILVAAVAPSKLRSILRGIASEKLAGYFKDLCELPHVGFQPVPEPQRSGEVGAPWYFTNISDALLAFIESRAAALRSRLAETAITKEVRRWIEKSRNMRRPVMFVGNSRFGKTEAVRLEAAADPGNCRLVNTPSSNAMSDLLREVAKSLGLEVGPQSAGRELRERIDYVLRFSRLQLIFDESQFLLPGNYSRNTAPGRLNWVRRSIIDQDSASVFVCTPQSYLPAKKRFAKVTGFVMEQWDERMLTRNLPDELSEEDLLAVARIHFADIAKDYLHFVVDTVLATERNFVSDIEKIATLAKDNAREAGRSKTLMADIEAAIADVLPVLPVAAPSAQKTAEKTPLQRPCRKPAPLLPALRAGLEISNRSRFSRPVEVQA